MSEQRNTEQLLHETHLLLNAFVEAIPDPLWFKDLQGRYLMINSPAARCLGKNVSEVIGKTDWEFLPTELAQSIVTSDQRTFATEKPETIEVGRLVCTYRTTKSVYRDSSGKVRGLIGMSRDITQQKQLQEHGRQSQRMEAVGRLALGVVHDFNNLLTIINGYSALVIAALPVVGPHRAMAAEIRSAGDRGAELTRQLMAFGRHEDLPPRLTDLNALLTELCVLLRRLIGEDIELSFVPEPQLAIVRVDPGQFERVIVNLALNARDAMPKGGRLTIETRCELVANDDLGPGKSRLVPYVVVAVTDSGHGMEEAVKRRIFEAFFTTKPAGMGTGLGLSIVYDVMKRLGGYVEVQSEPGHGSAFTLYLPCEQATSAAPSMHVTSAPTEQSTRLPDGRTGNETILIVEDEGAVRKLAKYILESIGYTVLDARDGQEALEIVQSYVGPIHLLVTDLVMPRMGGRQLADALAQILPAHPVRVLFMSGHDAPESSLSVLKEGIAFLQKPFGPADLAEKVRELLDSARQGAGAIVRT
jgi:PAS domain S-box-containing protein